MLLPCLRERGFSFFGLNLLQIYIGFLIMDIFSDSQLYMSNSIKGDLSRLGLTWLLQLSCEHGPYKRGSFTPSISGNNCLCSSCWMNYACVTTLIPKPALWHSRFAHSSFLTLSIFFLSPLNMMLYSEHMRIDK